MDQILRIGIRRQACAFSSVLHNTNTAPIQHKNQIEALEFSSTATAATSKKETVAIAIITGIFWGAVAKATFAPRAALFVVLRRSIEQVS